MSFHSALQLTQEVTSLARGWCGRASASSLMAGLPGSRSTIALILSIYSIGPASSFSSPHSPGLQIVQPGKQRAETEPVVWLQLSDLQQ